MNIYLHEMRLYKKAIAVWNLTLLLIISIVGIIFPAFQNSIGAMNKVLDSFPDTLKQMFGLAGVDLSDLMGFFGFMFMYFTLIGAIQASHLGLSLLSNEVRDKTSDFLIAKPVKRVKIVFTKLMVGLTHVVITNILFLIVSFVLLGMIDQEFNKTIYLLYCGSLFMIQLIFLTLGMALSVFMDKLKTVMPVALGISFGFFVLGMVNDTIAGRPLTFISPFAYFNAQQIYRFESYDLKWLVMGFVLVIIFMTVTFLKYMKKDMPSV